LLKPSSARVKAARAGARRPLGKYMTVRVPGARAAHMSTSACCSKQPKSKSAAVGMRVVSRTVRSSSPSTSLPRVDRFAMRAWSTA